MTREPRARARGELYDLIWAMRLPPIRLHGETVVSESDTQGVLLAMASHTNPTRDQKHGEDRTWQCFANNQRLAEQARVPARTVQRVQQVMQDYGYIELIEQGARPGRGGGAAKPSRWLMYPRRWPSKPSKNGNHEYEYASVPTRNKEFASVPTRNTQNTEFASVNGGIR